MDKTRAAEALTLVLLGGVGGWIARGLLAASATTAPASPPVEIPVAHTTSRTHKAHAPTSEDIEDDSDDEGDEDWETDDESELDIEARTWSVAISFRE